MKQINESQFNRAAKTAKLIGHNGKWKRDRIQSLYKTKRGRLLLKLETFWRGEHDEFWLVDESEIPLVCEHFFTGSWNRYPELNALLEKHSEEI